MKIVGMENEDPNMVYNKKRICASHFTADCSSPGTKRLNANAYPTLNMPGNLFVFVKYILCSILFKIIGLFIFNTVLLVF